MSDLTKLCRKNKKLKVHKNDFSSQTNQFVLDEMGLHFTLFYAIFRIY